MPTPTKPSVNCKLVDIAARCPSPIDWDHIKILARHFGVSLKPIVETLERHGIAYDGGQHRTSQEKGRLEQNETSRLGKLCLKLNESEPVEKTSTEKLEAPRENERSGLFVLHSKLSVHENQLQMKERELADRERAMASREVEDANIMETNERARDAYTQYLKRDRSAQVPVKLYHEGIVRQMLLNSNAELSARLREVEQKHEARLAGRRDAALSGMATFQVSI